MIERLFIRNLILIDETHLAFGPALNILTGETGSGKSAVLSALRLILGERADVGLIGKHSDLAVVEAEVWVRNFRQTIRREINRSGKSRCFVNDELVSLSELRDLFNDCLEIADQGAAYKLSDPEELRKLLDTFGRIDSTLFATVFLDVQEKKRALEELRKGAGELRLEETRLREQLTFLDQIDWQPGEEEKLTETHSLLTRIQKMAENLTEIGNFLSEGPHPILPTIKRFANKTELPELANWLHAARANLEEASQFLASHLANIECSTDQLEAIEQRISEIESVKRRVAKTEPEARAIRETLRLKLTQLDQFEEDLQTSQAAYLAAEEMALLQERSLSEARRYAADVLQVALLSELHGLNLPNAQLEIQIKPKARCKTGADEVQWLFSANPGQPLSLLNHVASGGELSRLLLAVKIALKEKKCLILDEIDGNVGGQTATLLGLKLKELSSCCQIICVTHFVQVAKCAMHHFLVTKETRGSNAITTLQKLDEISRQVEYARMMGALS